MKHQLQLFALEDVPLIEKGDDLCTVINAALQDNQLSLQDGDILVLAQKIVSKAEGRLIDLNTVTPGAKALSLADEVHKDPRLVELILSESRSVIRKKPGVLITEHRLGFIMANAGIDASNVNADAHVLLLPLDSDSSCNTLRGQFTTHWRADIGVMINDSFGRPWRLGTSGVVLGAAGIPCLWDKRGEADLFGRELKTSLVAIGDEVAAAASLLQGQGDEGRPVVLVRGLDLTPGKKIPNTSARALVRTQADDMFR